MFKCGQPVNVWGQVVPGGEFKWHGGVVRYMPVDGDVMVNLDVMAGRKDYKGTRFPLSAVRPLYND